MAKRTLFVREKPAKGSHSLLKQFVQKSSHFVRTSKEFEMLVRRKKLTMSESTGALNALSEVMVRQLHARAPEIVLVAHRGVSLNQLSQVSQNPWPLGERVRVEIEKPGEHKITVNSRLGYRPKVTVIRYQ